jgi:hypothetical protein
MNKTLSGLLGGALAVSIASNAYFLMRQSTTESTFVNDKGEEFTITQKDIDSWYAFMDPLSVEDEAELAIWKQKNLNLDSTYGTPFSPVGAATKLKEFDDWNMPIGQLVRRLKPNGFAFGKNRLRKLLRGIDSLNNKTTDPNKQIFGVRIYMTHTPRETEPKRNHLDLMFVPIKRDGTPFHGLFNKGQILTQVSDTTNTLLNTSLPCPDACQ